MIREVTQFPEDLLEPGAPGVQSSHSAPLEPWQKPTGMISSFCRLLSRASLLRPLVSGSCEHSSGQALEAVPWGMWGLPKGELGDLWASFPPRPDAEGIPVAQMGCGESLRH